jgi:hypothetical protein
LPTAVCVPGGGVPLRVPEAKDVLFQLSAEQHLIRCFRFGALTNEISGSGKDGPAFRGEVDVGAPAVPAWFLGQESEALQPPQHLAQALPAHAEHVGKIRRRGWFQFRRCLECVQ